MRLTLCGPSKLAENSQEQVNPIPDESFPELSTPANAAARMYRGGISLFRSYVMAFLYLTEYAALSRIEGLGVAPFPQEPPIAEQTVANAGASTQSAAFSAGTQFIRISADSPCTVAIGANPVATAANARLPANTDRLLGVKAGQKLAAFVIT